MIFPEESSNLFNGDDIATLLYAAHGFVVVASCIELKVGDTPPWSSHVRSRTPVRIVAVSSRQEWDRQTQTKIEGWERDPLPFGYCYFYRVEAMD